MRGDDTFGVGESMPESFSGKDLKNRRTPDDVLFIHDEVEGQLAPGRYAIEDKAGPNAFKIDQARDYARRAYKPGQRGGGFVQTKDGTKPVYDGLVYVFSNRAEAVATRELMHADALISKVLNKEPGGIHIMYADNSGMIRRLKSK
jgi:hypothetical protein